MFLYVIIITFSLLCNILLRLHFHPRLTESETLREYMHHLLLLEHRAEEQFLEHWLNPHCKPHCDRNLVHPI
ncbi:hypothetical protein FD754_000982 [Muntiacus muntjak]|uniref:Uncharacterized protein n=1 Tax=Muntiacus muntjak TaxID=9888 RepID=A0A5N3W8Z3_MUNMU|nr:hypothetical protein FD754_000982 [Muntiacus muntjak]